jgi:hypothetical protein
MCTVFWDRKGVLLVEFSLQSSTNKTGVYCVTQSRISDVGAVMLHDDARPHTAAATQDLIATFGWEQFDDPPYAE